MLKKEEPLHQVRWRDLATFIPTTHRWLIESMECQPERFVLSGIMAIQKYNIIESPPPWSVKHDKSSRDEKALLPITRSAIEYVPRMFHSLYFIGGLIIR